jgi:carbon-monoxide dehydrogenase small subunit
MRCDKIGDTSPKAGAIRTCGACSVIIDGELRLSCLTLAKPAARHHHHIGAFGRRRPAPAAARFPRRLRRTMRLLHARMIMAARCCSTTHNPSREDVVEALSSICRCTGYEPIIRRC